MIEARGRDDGQVRSGLVLHEEPDRSLVTARGEIDLIVRQASGPLCQTVFERHLPLVVDASEVTFVDSAGVSVLVRLARDAEAGGYPVVLQNAPWMLKELLTVTGVDRLLPFGQGEPVPPRPTAPVDEPDMSSDHTRDAHEG
jgi:anti-anti-sigma factor